MNFERIREKLNILADAAKYDVSCASSGVLGKIPKTVWGILPEWEFAIATQRMEGVFRFSRFF